jgi:hypothetical protein
MFLLPLRLHDMYWNSFTCWKCLPIHKDHQILGGGKLSGFQVLGLIYSPRNIQHDWERCVYFTIAEALEIPVVLAFSLVSHLARPSYLRASTGPNVKSDLGIKEHKWQWPWTHNRVPLCKICSSCKKLANCVRKLLSILTAMTLKWIIFAALWNVTFLTNPEVRSTAYSWTVFPQFFVVYWNKSLRVLRFSQPYSSG